jgi:hypothetical protein
MRDDGFVNFGAGFNDLRIASFRPMTFAIINRGNLALPTNKSHKMTFCVGGVFADAMGMRDSMF